MPPELRLELKAVKAGPRGARTAAQLMAAEATRIEAALPRGARRIALDERGERVTSTGLAARIVAWQRDGRDAALIAGGPDALDDIAEKWPVDVLAVDRNDAIVATPGFRMAFAA